VISLFAGVFLDPADASEWIFRSVWFLGLIVLFMVNLGACTIIRFFPFRPKRAGFYITRLSIIVICVGLFIDAAFGEIGYVTVQKGETNHVMRLVDTNAPKPLPFGIRLESFSIERYSGAYRSNLRRGRG
jgi:cytochrome c biogenesis protein ResB